MVTDELDLYLGASFTEEVPMSLVSKTLSGVIALAVGASSLVTAAQSAPLDITSAGGLNANHAQQGQSETVAVDAKLDRGTLYMSYDGPVEKGLAKCKRRYDYAAPKVAVEWSMAKAMEKHYSSPLARTG